jgi:hypothetical protein
MLSLSYYFNKVKNFYSEWYNSDINRNSFLYFMSTVAGTFGFLLHSIKAYQLSKDTVIMTNTFHTIISGIGGGVYWGCVGYSMSYISYFTWPVFIPVLILRIIDRKRFDLSIFLDKSDT